MKIREEDEAFFKEMEDYIMGFHLDNGADEKRALMLAKMNSYWNRKNLNHKRKLITRGLRKNFKQMIEAYRSRDQLTNYELLDVLYREFEDIISYEESLKQKNTVIKHFLYVDNGKIVARLNQCEE